MTRTHEKVSHSPEGERIEHTPISAAQGIEQAFKFVEGRWKLLILFHLFGGKVMRFSDLERAISAISQKMLAQQLPGHDREVRIVWQIGDAVDVADLRMQKIAHIERW